MSDIKRIAKNYNVGDIVYHNSTMNERGVVTDCLFSVAMNDWVYEVSFSPGNVSLCYPSEISNQKTYI